MKENTPEVLDIPTRLRLARSILERTANDTGAGFLLVMFVPGTDLVLRSFAGLDSPEEAQAMTAEVAGLMAGHVEKLQAKGPKPLHNES